MSEMRRLLYSDSTGPGPCQIEATTLEVDPDKNRNLLGGFPKLGIPFLGVPIIRTIIYWGLYLGSPYFGKLPLVDHCLSKSFEPIPLSETYLHGAFQRLHPWIFTLVVLGE